MAHCIIVKISYYNAVRSVYNEKTPSIYCGQCFKVFLKVVMAIIVAKIVARILAKIVGTSSPNVFKRRNLVAVVLSAKGMKSFPLIAI